MMSLQLPDKNLTDGINKLIRQEESFCLEILEKVSSSNRHNVIHELRKSGKKIRAMLRFIRHAIGEESYKAENGFYRDMGKQIAELRDSTAIIEALQHIKGVYQPELANDAFEVPLKTLRAHRQKMVKQYLTGEKRLENISNHLQEKTKQQNHLSPDALTFDHVASGMRKVYARGLESFNKSKHSKDTNDLHEWRKRVKYLRYQYEIFTIVWPNVMNAYTTELDSLADFLGLDHDLSILHEQISGGRVNFKDEAEKGLLSALINFQRDQLQRLAFLLGSNLYQDDPDSFAKKITAYWDNYQQKLLQNEEVNIASLEQGN
ncbi:hypothetical protein C900_03696 [Fulvivirga imtechensis AK7]|uniref:CHAD domain-containing protein n=1 Tax=Fulvivirga imtechensis AK7 TaxID=1237149 RepID=L8JSV2_9BACT|nr:CHAD domain-containing protein [Fulvivirga imtechensis]ELR70442.1 hypothetical protein C900_03696 [Fulvivirga imtechensis AK7]